MLVDGKQLTPGWCFLHYLSYLLTLGPCPPFPWCLSRRPFFLNVYQTHFSAGRCWLVAAFLPGLTGRAMMSAFLSSAHCQLKWFSQRKLQGKVHPCPINPPTPACTIHSNLASLSCEKCSLDLSGPSPLDLPVPAHCHLPWDAK